MKKKHIKKLSQSAMFIAIALMLPFVAGQIPEIGNMLLPMHLPVMLCGLVCGAGWGGAVGLIAPILRSIIFARPPLYPSAIAMAAELATYGLVIGFVYSLRKKSLAWLYFSLILSMIAGRLVWAPVMAALMGFNGFTLSYFFTESVLLAVPGIILQLILIPILMLLFKKSM